MFTRCTGFFAGLLLMTFALAGANTAAIANDRELRAITIPPSACQKTKVVRSTGVLLGENLGWQVLVSLNGSVFINFECPLSISNIKLSNATGSIKMTSFRVHYTDSDAKGEGIAVYADLISLTHGSGVNATTQLCSFNSNTDGSATINPVAVTKVCNLTLQSNTFYQFRLTCIGGSRFGSVRAVFAGIDFP